MRSGSRFGSVRTHPASNVATVEANVVADGNATGIFVRNDYNVVIRDNVVSNVTGKTLNEYGECVTIVSAIPVPVVNNTLRDCRIGVWIKRGGGHDLARNTVTNATVANVTWGLYLDETFGAVWADVHDNNTFSGWTYGVWIDAAVVDVPNFNLFWNDVRSNGEGVHVTGDPPGADFFHAECNWWNPALGPHDLSPGVPDQNDNPPGQPVSDWFWYRDPPPPPARTRGWLNGASSSLGTTCTGGL